MVLREKWITCWVVWTHGMAFTPRMLAYPLVTPSGDPSKYIKANRVSQQPYIQICLDLPGSEYINLDLDPKVWGGENLQHLLRAPPGEME